MDECISTWIEPFLSILVCRQIDLERDRPVLLVTAKDHATSGLLVAYTTKGMDV